MLRSILFISIILFASCGTCERYTKNYVVDKETRIPLFEVQVLSVAATDGKQEMDKYTYTDAFGGFETSFTKGNVTQCPVLKLTLNKAGYYPVRYWDPPIGDTLEMIKIVN
jgi:hypothetical protein